MKIVIAGPAGNYGGLEVHMSELIRFLAASGHSLLCIQVLNTTATQSSNGSTIQVPDWPGLRGKVAKIIYWAYSCLRVRVFAPDLLISAGIGHGYSWLSRLSGAGCFTVLQIVTDDFSHAAGSLHRIIGSFDAIGPQTPTLKQKLATSLDSSLPAEVLPCFHQIVRSNSRLIPCPPSVDGIRLSYFGRLAGNKGLPLLVRAVQKLGSPLLASLDLWGVGPVRDELNELLRQLPEINSIINLKGCYPAGQAYTDLLASYHGLVLPSQACEGLPLVLLEAASVGLPVLATRIGGIQDFSADNQDVVAIDVGLHSLCKGLEDFLSKIHSGHFNRCRQQAFFNRYYSRASIEETWQSMLMDVPKFFGISGKSSRSC
jgi:glycosyltransferase involved in cell wall biosynthesis